MSKYLKPILKVVGALLLLGVVGFIGIQLVPVERSNPPVVSEPKWDSPQTRALAERACFDCHSNETKWPWYAKVAPVSWLVAHDVGEGRTAVNFSEWGVNKGAGGEEGMKGGENALSEIQVNRREEGEGGGGVEPGEIAGEVEEGKMPLSNYLLMHPEARLTPTELQTLISGLKATFSSGAEGAMVR